MLPYENRRRVLFYFLAEIIYILESHIFYVVFGIAALDIYDSIERALFARNFDIFYDYVGNSSGGMGTALRRAMRNRCISNTTKR